jgi:hypothetical protein
MSDVAAGDVLRLLAIDHATGCLTPGRHPATFAELRRAFVEAEEFAGSGTRAAKWEGFLAYVAAWDQVEALLDDRLVLAWWIGGSFVTSAVEVGDIDVSPILNRDVWKAKRGAEGMGTAKALIRHRQKVADAFGVEPFVLLWSAVSCTLFADDLSVPEQEMLRNRGGLDAWWQRRRPAGEKAAPGLPTAFAERGYVEVLR